MFAAGQRNRSSAFAVRRDVVRARNATAAAECPPASTSVSSLEAKSKDQARWNWRTKYFNHKLFSARTGINRPAGRPTRAGDAAAAG